MTLLTQPSTQPDAPRAICIMGPTASGKTDLAIECLQELPVELISVDSALVYRDMDIGTAKPDAETLKQAPHRLIDILDPSESYSAAGFRTDALREMADITASGKIPVLVGGTMLYFRALQQGLAVLPSADESIRAEIEQLSVTHGWQYLHDQLQQVDPQSAARIHVNDPQRLQRALEVYYSTGRTLTELWQEQQASDPGYELIKIALFPSDRALLRERIAERFMRMLELGFINEVTQLRARGNLDAQMPSMRCVGYRQAWAYLEGEIDFDSMVETAINATRQLAKRQLTWLRKELDCNFFDVNKAVFPEILKKLKNSL